MVYKKLITSILPDVKSIPKRLQGIRPFVGDYINYRQRAKEKKQPLPRWKNIYPRLDDRYQSSGSIPGHYFYQDLWAARLVYDSKPEVHYDIGSSIAGFIAHVSVFNKVKVIDIRPQSYKIENVEFIQGDITDLNIENESIESLSCLHAAEHIGLGRYGDNIDPLGTMKAAEELQRVLAIGGDLYFALPIGRERICFNAHRVLLPQTVLAYFNQLHLVSFSVIDDSEEFIRNAEIRKYESSDYSCGLFHFRKQHAHVEKVIERK